MGQVTVAEAVGLTLARLGVSRVFGVVGSGNFHMTNALLTGGMPFVAARHEMGATCMADAYTRTTESRAPSVALGDATPYTYTRLRNRPPVPSTTMDSRSRNPVTPAACQVWPPSSERKIGIRNASALASLGIIVR